MIGRSASHGGQLRPSQLRGAVSERWSNNDGGADEIALISKPTVDAPVGLELEARGQQVQVARVTAGGLAEASGAIFEGDTIISINNQECGWQAPAPAAAKLLRGRRSHASRRPPRIARVTPPVAHVTGRRAPRRHRRRRRQRRRAGRLFARRRRTPTPPSVLRARGHPRAAEDAGERHNRGRAMI